MGDAEYGLGWHIRKDAKGRRQVLHGGASAGADVQFTLVPEGNVCVVVLAIVMRHWPGAVTEAVTNAILAEVHGVKPDDFPTLRPDTPAAPARLPGPLAGGGSGAVQTHQGRLDVALWFRDDGRVEVQTGRQATAAVRHAALVGTSFTGKTGGDFGTDDARRRP
jgi:hypothetical protein